jgi:hypothetical protein
VPRLPAEKELAAVAEKGKVTSTSGAASSATATANVTAAKAAGETPPALADPNNTGLVLVGWSPYRLNFPYQAHLRRIADQFSSLRRFMGMKFPGIFVWQIPSDAIENLKFRLKWQDRESITDFFCDTLQNLQDLEKRLLQSQPFYSVRRKYVTKLRRDIRGRAAKAMHQPSPREQRESILKPPLAAVLRLDHARSPPLRSGPGSPRHTNAPQ